MLSEIRISRSALVHNVKAFRRVIGPKVKLMAIVKSNAYGHGVGECAPVFEKAGADWFGVASVSEALALRAHVKKKPILVLSYVDVSDNSLRLAINQNIHLPAYTLQMLQKYQRMAKLAKTSAKVHIKFDTGTTRIGFLPNEISKIIIQLRKFSRVNVVGVFSHFAEVETKNQKFTKLQYLSFTTLASKLEFGIGKRLIKHMDCSAGVLVLPDAHFDMVRVGMSLYGIYTVVNFQRTHKNFPKFYIKPALSWYTRVIQIKQVPAGTTVGYNRTYQVSHAAKIAVLPIGYWEGFNRGLSNRGKVYFIRKSLPVRGRVCMNLTMVDATTVSNLKTGDLVELLGSHLPVEVMSKLCGTIPYEILTRLNPLIPRSLVA